MFIGVLITVAALTTVSAYAQVTQLAAGSPPPGSLSFLPVVTYDPGVTQAAMVAVADVNGDAKPDLIVLNCGNRYGPPSITNPGSAAIMLGNGDGTFQKAVTYGTGTASPGLSSGGREWRRQARSRSGQSVHQESWA